MPLPGRIRRLLPHLPLPWLLAGGAIVMAPLLGSRVGSLMRGSLELAALSTVIAILLGSCAAVLIAKTDAPGRRWLLAALIAQLFVPLYLHAAAWDAGFGVLGWFTQRGVATGPVEPLLSGLGGAAWVHGMAATPWVALIMAASLSRVPADYEEDALLDAPPRRVLVTVSLRAVLLAGVVSAVWSMLWSVSEMTVADLFQIRTFAEEIYTQGVLGLFDPGSPPADAFDAEAEAVSAARLPAQGLIVGAAMLTLMTTALLLIVVQAHRPAVATTPRPSWRWHLRRWSGSYMALGKRFLGGLAVAGLLLLLTALPLGNLIYKMGIQVDRVPEASEQLDGEVTSATGPASWQRSWSLAKASSLLVQAPWEHRRELWQSIKVGIAVAMTATIIGGGIAWLLVTSHRQRFVWLVVLAIGLVIPGPLLGIATIWLLNHPWDSWVAGLTWLYDHTLVAPWLVQTARATPVACLVLWSAFFSVPTDLLDVARTEGLGRWRQLFRIVLPLCKRSFLAAWILSLAISLGELSATVLVIPPGPPTVAVRTFSLLHYGVEDRLAALCLVTIGLFGLLTMLVAWLQRSAVEG